MDRKLPHPANGRPSRLASRAAAFLVLLAAGCGGPTEPGILQIYYDPSLSIDIRTFTQTASGLFYKDEVVGAGTQAAAGSVVEFALEGWYPSGEYVYPKEVVRNVTIGSNDLIVGIDEGLRGMRPGGMRKIVLPPHLAHGGARVFVYSLEMMDVR